MKELIPATIKKSEKNKFLKSEEARLKDVRCEVAHTITSAHKGGGTDYHNSSVDIEKQIVAMRGRNPENPGSREPGQHTEQRLEPNQMGLSNTITTVQKDNMVLVKESDGSYTRYRVRKLTPKECALMGVTDEDIEKMQKSNSNTELYRQFGDSIVVDVMCAMFRRLNIRGAR